MKRTITTLALAGALLVLGASPAFATHPEDIPYDDAAAPSTEDCRPGGNSDITGSWTLYSQEGYVELLLERLADRGLSPDDLLPEERWREGGEDGLIDTWGELLIASAQATWDFCDHNGDGLACVLVQEFPNDHPPFSLTILDNHPFPSEGGR